MPYIERDRRAALATTLARAEGPGELNFQISYLLHLYLSKHGLNYRAINDIVGALEGAKLEFYTRVARPYEDTKIAANGDVYTGKETNGGV